MNGRTEWTGSSPPSTLPPISKVDNVLLTDRGPTFGFWSFEFCFVLFVNRFILVIAVRHASLGLFSAPGAQVWGRLGPELDGGDGPQMS